VLFVLLGLSAMADCRSVDLLTSAAGASSSAGRQQRHLPTSRHQKRDRDCEIYQSENLHAVMDRFCMECESIFRNSVDQQDIHANCRKDCFANDVFEWCWNQIRPGGVDTHFNLR